MPAPVSLRDCGFCEQLKRCGAGVSRKDDYFYFSAKMLCEITYFSQGLYDFVHAVTSVLPPFSTGLGIPLTDTAITELVPAQGPGIKISIANGIISNSSLVSTIVYVRSGATILFQGTVAPGENLRINQPLLGNDNESITIQAGTGGASILASVTGTTVNA